MCAFLLIYEQVNKITELSLFSSLYQVLLLETHV